MKNCTLCQGALSTHTIREEEDVFCCHGCHAVYRVLSAKGIKDHIDHPLFRAAVDNGLISNPALLEQLRERESQQEGESRQLHLEIGDLWCPSCSEVIRLVLSSQEGISSVIVDYATDQAVIHYNPQRIGQEEIYQNIRSLGYTPKDIGDPRGQGVSKALWLRFAIAAFCAMNSMMFAYPIYVSYFTSQADSAPHIFARISFVLTLPVISFCAWPIYRRFWNALWAGIYGMEALVVMSVTAAFGCSTYELMRGGVHVYFDSLSVIIALVLAGKIIESRAKFSAKDALIRLDRALPRKGRKRTEDGQERFCPLKEIQEGDVVVVLTGERVPLDGHVLSGEALLDESVLTGESIPVQKVTGATVLSGSVVKQGRLVLSVTTSEEGTTLHHMIKMVEADIGDKPISLRAVDRVILWFVPVVIILSFLTLIGALLIGKPITAALIQAVTVLLISCPCAIGVAAPLVESQLLNALAKMGAIVRNRAVLPALAKVSLWCFDKTGTVTEGCFKVQHGVENLSEKEKHLLFSIASCSHHPIASAIVDALPKAFLEVSEVTEVPGRGVMGSVDGKRLLLGSAAFLKSFGIEPMPLKQAGSRTYFAIDHRCVAAILLDDGLKPEVPAVVQALGKTALLSGDAPEPVKAIADRVGFTEWKAEETPLDKRQYIWDQRKEGDTVLMVGDGINDAPALTVADVGISVVRASDMSVQVSDILLTTEKLTLLPEMKTLAIRGQKILWQNLSWAFSYNIIGIGLAMYGSLSPLYAAVAMVCSSLVVLLNASRVDR